MTTINELLTDTLIDLGRLSPAETIDPNDLAHGIRVANRLIGSFATKRLLIPYTTSESFDGDGTASYTMGTAGTASDTRALRITSAYIDGSSDNPIKIIGQEEYNGISDKTTTGESRYLFYDPIYPIGIIYLYPIPSASYTIYIESIKALHATLTTGDTVSLSKEYEDFLVLALRNRLAGSFGVQVTPVMIRELTLAENDIRVLNSSNQTHIMEIPGVGGIGYNIETDI